MTFNNSFHKQIIVQNAVVSEFGVNNIRTSSSITKVKWRFCRDVFYAIFETAERRVVSVRNIYLNIYIKSIGLWVCLGCRKRRLNVANLQLPRGYVPCFI